MKFEFLINGIWFDEVQKAGGIVPNSDSLVDQENSVASFFMSFKYPGHDPWVWWFSSSPGGWLLLWLRCRSVWLVLGSDSFFSVCK